MKKRYLYIASAPTYAGPKKDDIKVGISNDPWKRVKNFYSVNPLLDLAAVFEFLDENYPVILECAFISQFSCMPLMRVVGLDDDYEPILRPEGKEFFCGDVRRFIGYAHKKSNIDNQQYERVL